MEEGASPPHLVAAHRAMHGKQDKGGGGVLRTIVVLRESDMDV